MNTANKNLLHNKEAVTAFLNGEKIEFNTHSDKTWRETNNPLWSKNCYYRVKPIVLTRTVWINVYPDHLNWAMEILHNSEKSARDSADYNCIATKKVTFEYFKGEGHDRM